MSDGQTQKIVDAIAEVTRKRLGKVSRSEIDGGWQRLESALSDGKFPSVPILATRPRWWLRGFALTAAALALGFATYRLLPLKSDSPLHYVLEGAPLGPGESIKAGPAGPAKLIFSDGSQVRIAPAAKLAVLALDAHGSRIALADGDLDVQVQHRAGSSWRFEAGPFTVKVRGTEFHLAYAAEQGRLALQMVTGVVEVRGSSDDRVLTLRAGESLELFAGSARNPVVSAPAQLPEAEKPTEDKQPTEVAPAVAAPVAPRTSPTSLRHRAPQAERTLTGAAPIDWAGLIAQGDFSGVVKDAQNRGIDATIASASAAELTSLADAARYTKHSDLARQALLGLRARYADSARASDAAFFLGRLAETPSSASSGAAVTWYETYLRESAHGPYAGEALAREIALLARTDRPRAQRAAQTYLERFPHGTQAELAKSLLESAPK
jgi:transmembrane sensor